MGECVKDEDGKVDMSAHTVQMTGKNGAKGGPYLYYFSSEQRALDFVSDPMIDKYLWSTQYIGEQVCRIDPLIGRSYI